MRSWEIALNSLWRWIPVAINKGDSGFTIDWLFAGDRRFTEPFFQDTLSCLPKGPGLTSRTGPDAFGPFRQSDCLAPSALIFHASRCGSTLLTQLLATSRQCIAISEAPVVDSALHLYLGDVHAERRIELLQDTVRALGQRRCGDEECLVLKLDAWNISESEVLFSL